MQLQILVVNCNWQARNCNLCSKYAITHLLTIEATKYYSTKKNRLLGIIWWIKMNILFTYRTYSLKLVLQHSWLVRIPSLSLTTLVLPFVFCILHSPCIC